MLPCVCLVTDHRRRQNVVNIREILSYASDATFLFSPHLDFIIAYQLHNGSMFLT